VIILMIVLWNAMINRSESEGTNPSSNSARRERALPARKKEVTFADVAGAEEEKEELQESSTF
jgi:cell division protease FtsH